MKIWVPRFSKRLEKSAVSLEKLEKTVSSIQAILKDAEEQQIYSHQDKDWLDRLKDAVNEVEEFLREFNTKAS